MSFQSINPANGEVLATYEEMKPDQLPGLIGKVHDAFLSWRRTSFDDRAKLMRQAAQVLRKDASEYARLMAREMGKPVRDGVAVDVRLLVVICGSVRLLQPPQRRFPIKFLGYYVPQRDKLLALIGRNKDH